MKCPKCREEMESLGNISGVTYTTYPAQWDEVYVCHKCKVRKTERVHDQLPTLTKDISDYKEWEAL